MCNDRVTSVYYLGVVTAFIEHTHIDAKNVCVIYSTSHSTFIRADHHQMICINLKVRHVLQKCFDELIRRLNGFETIQRNCVLNARIMCIKGDNTFNTHLC